MALPPASWTCAAFPLCFCCSALTSLVLRAQCAGGCHADAGGLGVRHVVIPCAGRGSFAAEKNRGPSVCGQLSRGWGGFRLQSCGVSLSVLFLLFILGPAGFLRATACGQLSRGCHAIPFRSRWPNSVHSFAFLLLLLFIISWPLVVASSPYYAGGSYFRRGESSRIPSVWVVVTRMARAPVFFAQDLRTSSVPLLLSRRLFARSVRVAATQMPWISLSGSCFFALLRW